MVVVWRVTEQCNLACRFCAYDRELLYPRRNADIERVRAFGQVLADFITETGQQVLVSWHGGEPLLWGPLEAITMEFRRSHGIRVSTTTNGTPLASAVVREHLVGEYDELTISVDALGVKHDRLRSWPGGFAELRRNVMQLSDEIRRGGSSLKLRANVVLMRDTIGEFGALCRELAGWGLNELTFNQLGGIDRPEFYPHNRLLPEQVEYLAADLPGLRKELAALGLKLCGSDGYLGRLHATASNQRIGVSRCDAAKHFLFIDECGLVAPCTFTVQELGLPLEEISSSNALNNLAEIFSKIQRKQAPPACSDCHSTQLFNKFFEG